MLICESSLSFLYQLVSALGRSCRKNNRKSFTIQKQQPQLGESLLDRDTLYIDQMIGTCHAAWLTIGAMCNAYSTMQWCVMSAVVHTNVFSFQSECCHDQCVPIVLLFTHVPPALLSSCCGGRLCPCVVAICRRTTRSSMSAPASTRSSAPPKLRGRGRGVGATAAARNVRLRREFQDRGKSLAGRPPVPLST
jgi:hypothetical protein